VRWLTRGELPATADGLCAISPDADTIVPLGEADRAAARQIAAATFAGAGVSSADRAVLAINNDGSTGMAATALGEVAGAVASVGPRGRLRLHRALEAMRATTLMITPTGAMDLLARLHLEFLLDPLDLELERILLIGEIASPGCHAQLAAEFDADVVELYADPFFELPLASRRPDDAAYTPSESLARARLDKDVLDPAGQELVLTPAWHSTLGDAVLRTGHVVGSGADVPPVEHTVGDHLLVRGRWLSIPALRDALHRIDGIARWELRVARAGTLDSAELLVTFARESLVRNPMWKGRIEQTLTAVTPVRIGLTISDEASAATAPGVITDLRGHHLGTGRWT
jgi:phenylacetate-CoA ligase